MNNEPNLIKSFWGVIFEEVILKFATFLIEYTNVPIF